uniref:Uncharacterized protein n=1 Tax=Tetranychus urticae TaxID=32264 RepID=T1KAR7_TETUR
MPKVVKVGTSAPRKERFNLKPRHLFVKLQDISVVLGMGGMRNNICTYNQIRHLKSAIDSALLNLKNFGEKNKQLKMEIEDLNLKNDRLHKAIQTLIKDENNHDQVERNVSKLFENE